MHRPCTLIKNRLGFSLLELSVVLVIIALVTGMAMTSGTAVIAASRESATRQKMKGIEDALLAYRTTYNRLPCPASLTIAEGVTNFGVEGATQGTCTGGTPAANNSAAGVTNTTKTGVEGAVPVATLGLPNDYMYDGWGRRIRYAVDKSLTASEAFTSVTTACANLAITVKDANGGNRTTGAIYALLSHGENGHGGYSKQGVITNAASTNIDEQTNCHCNASATATTYAPTYVQKDTTNNAASATDNFDDIVTYKERWQVMTAWDIPTVCPQDIYVVDFFNYRIRKIMATTGVISTVAGTGSMGFNGDGIAATAAQLYYANSVALDSGGNLYIADRQNHRIRKVMTSTGIISTIAGTGVSGFSGDGGAATSAQLNAPIDVTVDAGGNVYIAGNHRIRKVTVATGIISTIAGTGVAGFSGDGGAATSAQFNATNGVAVDASGDVYIADFANNRIRKVTTSTGIISTVVGTGAGGFSGDGGAATAAQLKLPIDIVVDSSGNMYIADMDNHRIRKVTAATGIISTIAGTGTAGFSGDGGSATAAQLNNPSGVAVDTSGNIYIADGSNNRIRKVTTATGIISTIAGTGTAGFSGDGGSATAAQLYAPPGVVLR